MASRPSHFQLASTKTALALVPPLHLHPDINSLRSIYDKAYGKWQPHINILYPFVDPASLPAAITALRESLCDPQFGRVKVKITEVNTFKHRRNATVFLKPGLESEEALCQLRGVLVGALGCSMHDGTHDGEYKPHLTVGQAGLNGGALEKLVARVKKLVGLEWNSKALVVMKRDISGEMKVVEELDLVSPACEGVGSQEGLLSVYTGWRNCYSFTPNAGWDLLSEAIATTTNVPAELTVSTYNLMAEPSAPPFELRLPLIVEAISSTTSSNSSPRVLCLQEVTEDGLTLLLSEPLIQNWYPYSTHSPSSLLPSHRNLVTLASMPFRHFTLQFAERHKSALDISFDHLGIEVANVHLTSSLTDESVAAKKRQMASLTKFLTDAEKTSRKEIIVAGDFNLATSSRTIDAALSRGIISSETAKSIDDVIDVHTWQDAFIAHEADSASQICEETLEGEGGATFDRLTNPLAAMFDAPIDTSPQRYDRILYRKGGQIHVQRFKTFGFPKDGKCASDHYGTCATLKIERGDNLQINQNATTPEFPEIQIDDIELTDDSTDLQPLIEPYLPSTEDTVQREDALKLLRKTLTNHENLKDLVFAPLGSYAMETYFSHSDVDVLAIGSASSQIFFENAIGLLRGLDTRGHEGNDGFKAVHYVNSLVPIIELVVMGIKVDLQYCQTAEVLLKYHTTNPAPSLATLLFDTALISTLSPSSLRPLNTYRDTAYILTTISNLSSYRAAHRFLSLYLQRRGLYSAKCGYLGGIHLSLMLNRVVKLLRASLLSTGDSKHSEGSKLKPSNDQCTQLSPASIIRSFFTYYANFNWAKNSVSDPLISTQEGSFSNRTTRSHREPILIQSIHTPTARPNVAASCTRLSAQTLTYEFSLAAEKLALGDWEWCLRPKEDCISEFLNGYGSFIRVVLDVWDTDEMGGDKVREIIGSLESKMPALLVGLGRLDQVEGRVWPARFRILDSQTSEVKAKKDERGNQFKGYYLVGVSAKGKDNDAGWKKLLTGKVVNAMRAFERSIRESKGFNSGHVWLDVDVVPKKEISEMGLVVDERDWGTVGRYPGLGSADQNNTQSSQELAHHDVSPSSKSRYAMKQNSNSGKLRPAQDIISRIRWDPTLLTDEFLIGYEDRFAGVKELELSKWKTEQTDLEFIPMHRIVWVRRKGEDGEKVWDRREKVDVIFGSGIRKAKARDSRGGRI